MILFEFAELLHAFRDLCGCELHRGRQKPLTAKNAKNGRKGRKETAALEKSARTRMFAPHDHC